MAYNKFVVFCIFIALFVFPSDAIEEKQNEANDNCIDVYIDAYMQIEEMYNNRDRRMVSAPMLFFRRRVRSIFHILACDLKLNDFYVTYSLNKGYEIKSTTMFVTYNPSILYRYSEEFSKHMRDFVSEDSCYISTPSNEDEGVKCLVAIASMMDEIYFLHCYIEGKTLNVWPNVSLSDDSPLLEVFNNQYIAGRRQVYVDILGENNVKNSLPEDIEIRKKINSSLLCKIRNLEKNMIALILKADIKISELLKMQKLHTKLRAFTRLLYRVA